ncbi:sensor histidine kinase [Streptomyces albicerus]|uniref:sensor histidine kinase n=1 Tax=Streptomyces albicerus TaxID=2569859 RepID=UPI00124B2048|nr:histidine kinase [Streptomyces albicerus]
MPRPQSLIERALTAVNRPPAVPSLRNDAHLAAAVVALTTVMALFIKDGRDPDLLGWTLLLGAHVPLIWRRRYPMTAMLAVVACVAPYHALDYTHSAPVPATLLALYTVAVTGSARRTLLVGTVLIGTTLTVNAVTNPDGLAEIIRITGWLISVLLLGGYIRVHRQYLASALERAERAERTREEEARRRVAEERLRMARDLHDLLAHSITLIGVQTSVAAHVLAADPERLDRKAVAQALDDIAGTCRTARGELRTTLEVLRASDVSVEGELGAGTGSGPGSGWGSGSGDSRGPLPGLDGLADLAETARASGAKVELSVRADGVPPSVGAAAYRIVQEALTNAVRHGGRDDLTVRVGLWTADGALRVSVSDDGTGCTTEAFGGTPGFGLVGMRERARSVGGTLDAGPDPTEGFEVTAALPLPREEAR